MRVIPASPRATPPDDAGAAETEQPPLSLEVPPPDPPSPSPPPTPLSAMVLGMQAPERHCPPEQSVPSATAVNVQEREASSQLAAV